MGSCASKHNNPIDRRLAQALTAVKQRRGLHKFKFDELLLKFNKLARGFKKCRETFALLDTNGDTVIDIKEFTSQAHKLGLDSVSVEELAHIFDAADIDNSACIDVFEFVLVFVILHLLHPEQSARLAPEIRTALEIVEDAFCCFDASDDGLLEKEEVEVALCSKSAPAGRGSRALSEKLFKSLDFDGNGNISFKEFLIGLEKMVMEEYEEDDDMAEEVSRSSTGAPSRASIDRLRSMPRSSYGGGSGGGSVDGMLNPRPLGGSGLNPNGGGSGAPSVRTSLDMHRGSFDMATTGPAAGASGAATTTGVAGAAAAAAPPGALTRTGSTETRGSNGGAHASNLHVRLDATPLLVEKSPNGSGPHGPHGLHVSPGGSGAHDGHGLSNGGGLERGVSGDKVIRSALRNAVSVDACTGVPADMQPQYLD